MENFQQNTLPVFGVDLKQTKAPVFVQPKCNGQCPTSGFVCSGLIGREGQNSEVLALKVLRQKLI